VIVATQPYTIKAEKGELKGKLGPGIDIKGAGGQKVAPGSIHSSGALYQVETNEYIAETPGWMVNVLLKSAAGEKPEVVVVFRPCATGRGRGSAVLLLCRGSAMSDCSKSGALYGVRVKSGAAPSYSSGSQR
jgi:hypothetical protein